MDQIASCLIATQLLWNDYYIWFKNYSNNCNYHQGIRGLFLYLFLVKNVNYF
jgi:hypothetical protein